MLEVYFVQAGVDGPIKIGQATDVHKRLSGLQTDNHEELRLLATIPAKVTLEAYLHHRFRRGRIRGEWFKPTTKGLPELVASAQRGTIPSYALRHVQLIVTPIDALLPRPGETWVRHGAAHA